jgi:hypothetical protein
MTEKLAYPIPKTEAQVADRWITLMDKRLALQREVDAIEKEEKFLKAWIIDNLPRSRATGIAGKLVQVNIVDKSRPEVKDYDAFCEFVARNRKKGAFALLNRALNAKSIGEYWAAGRQVPGIVEVPYKSLSFSRLKK